MFNIIKRAKCFFAHTIKLKLDPCKNTLLVIAPRLPEYDRASGDLRLFRLLQILKINNNIVFFNNGMWERFLPQGELKYLNALTSMGIHCLHSETELRKTINTHEISLVLCEFHHLGVKYLPLLKKQCPRTPFIIDSVDVHFLRERMMAEILKDEKGLATAAKTKTAELKAYGMADSVWVVSTLDREALINEGIPSSKVAIVPNIHQVNANPIPREQRDENTLLFVGGFVHQPNVDAVEFLHKEVLPLVLHRIPNVHLLIVGDSPTEQIKKLEGPNVSVLGFVPDTQPFLDKAMVSVAPLRYGAGLKGKVGEALAAGIPLVTTSVGAQGMDMVSGQDAFVADTPQEFADAIVLLLNDPDLWGRCSSNGRSFMERHFGYSAVSDDVEQIFDTLLKKKGDMDEL